MKKNSIFRRIFFILMLVVGMILAHSDLVVLAQDQTQPHKSGKRITRRRRSANRRQRVAPTPPTWDISGGPYTGKLSLQKGEPSRDATLLIEKGPVVNPRDPVVTKYPFKLTTTDTNETRSGCLVASTERGYTRVALNFGEPCHIPGYKPDLVLSLRACNSAVGRTGEGILLTRGNKNDAFFASGNASCRRGFIVISQPEVVATERVNKKKPHQKQNVPQPPQARQDQKPVPPPIPKPSPSPARSQNQQSNTGFLRDAMCTFRVYLSLPKCKRQ